MGVFNDLKGLNTPSYQKGDSVRAKAGMGFDSMKNSSGLISPFENVTDEHILTGLFFTDAEIKTYTLNNKTPWD